MQLSNSFHHFISGSSMFRFTALLTLLWLPTLLVGYEKFSNFFFWRTQLTNYTGLLGLGYMCLAVLLAARFSWVESKVKGLDKGYALHKNLGIGATVALFSHWLIVKSGPWLVEAQILAMPNRGPRPEIEGINWHAVAEQVGDISFKVFLIFSLFSLVQAISYKKFKYTHKIGGLLVLAGVFHSMLLLNWSSASMAMNIAITILCIIGVWCSVLSLFGKIGKSNKVTGKVTEVKRFGRGDGTNSVVRLKAKVDSVIKYREGQFAYLNFHDGEAPHPFSVLNYDSETHEIEFGIKALGDYTNKLVNNLEKGQTVTIEGSYGRFQITDSKQQVWIGAGIGIVPFISRLYWLSRKAAKQNHEIEKVELFYCVNSKKEAYFEQEIITLLSQLNFIELHLLDAEKGELLSSDQILRKMAGKEYDVSFCGPVAFGQDLQSKLQLAGLPAHRFHNEIFKMR